MRWRRLAGMGAAILVLAGGTGIATGELPRWTIGGTQMVLPTALEPLSASPIVLPATGAILFVGDSNTAGSRVGGGRFAYPATFLAALPVGQTVRVHAFGGATVGDVLSRPLPEGAVALAFVMLGTNDAAPRAWLSAKRRIPLETYRTNLAELVQRLQAKGARVVILAPPPMGSRAMQRRLDPYRLAAKQVALACSCLFRDSAGAFMSKPDANWLQRDAMHLAPEAQQQLGLWLADQTTNASAAESSSTGKPNPASASQPS
ncbi:MAG: hypothetical protein B7Y36_17760 [Novosphingobium sp. 28-62-57]|uniref:SGNH/GDSL hydrolase family protein n=1 Tax=unclassified Novosphingobium TaxID=2644732 RepID=UPI000BC6109B|nr:MULTISPECIES: SGNH/GDSL hydrolase family protein [unclassified Novosphingobium]OYW47491.1 MAG: hypothetical protein B7Z36_03290 [Novosphingobium sp. 12-63-9]OYZ08155.1 MAG: hypothetical protein B7Y36_17760 [Novosphingobium sp. 28-62-57]OZA35816.1 MAG: hypothetical protein B7X92_08890 [Novosphingobium sp. 17-62-9]HQS68465.1 SGNH/GDSL hydrolase family protein [Novosphingobium sp.]